MAKWVVKKYTNNLKSIRKMHFPDAPSYRKMIIKLLRALRCKGRYVISDISIDKELIYDITTVSNILGVQQSTLKEYFVLMQKQDYQFNKNTVGHRVFYKKNIEVIRKTVELKNSGLLTLN